eukprot:CAMPEP_0184494198 /NCGR_PEP_ID=MMETSP0113_2-20130426/28092_1 /TAXON_ID=91329 /ORGANISM="Norrisiella sphaerica, Strain BC52" /LENGTH=537 /DNA_ID=CAMNT_0026879845 /DNA_START=14 /DNA_END=1627 /DNA_ORIENTATION=+
MTSITCSNCLAEDQCEDEDGVFTCQRCGHQQAFVSQADEFETLADIRGKKIVTKSTVRKKEAEIERTELSKPGKPTEVVLEMLTIWIKRIAETLVARLDCSPNIVPSCGKIWTSFLHSLRRHGTRCGVLFSIHNTSFATEKEEETVRAQLPKIHVSQVLAVVFLSCRMWREGVLLADLWRMARQGYIPFFNIYERLDPKIQQSVEALGLKRKLELLSEVPSLHVILHEAREISARAQSCRALAELPSVNVPKILCRWGKALCLPCHVTRTTLAVRKLKMYMDGEADHGTTAQYKETDLDAAVYLLLGLQLGFGLNMRGSTSQSRQNSFEEWTDKLRRSDASESCESHQIRRKYAMMLWGLEKGWPHFQLRPARELEMRSLSVPESKRFIEYAIHRLDSLPAKVFGATNVRDSMKWVGVPTNPSNPAHSSAGEFEGSDSHESAKDAAGQEGSPEDPILIFNIRDSKSGCYKFMRAADISYRKAFLLCATLCGGDQSELLRRSANILKNLLQRFSSPRQAPSNSHVEGDEAQSGEALTQ